MSYGIRGAYAINDRLKIRAGINRVDLNYTTKDVMIYNGSEAAARGISAVDNHIDFKPGMSSIKLLSKTAMNRSSTPEIVNTKYSSVLDQQFGYIEVPLEIEYTLLNKTFGVNLIGGFSTFLLNNNEIYADIDGTNTLIGEANNINSTSYSANFGIGFNYNVSEGISLNLEPTFKYQINTFNETSGDFQPFFLGVYSGLSFKF